MKEVTHNEWIINPAPRMMRVWDNSFDAKEEAKVICVAKDNSHLPVMTITKDYNGYCAYSHCAEIKEPKKRRMTNQELAWWLRGNPTREYKRKYQISIYYEYIYNEDNASEPVEDILIREDGGEWREPLVEVEE